QPPRRCKNTKWDIRHKVWNYIEVKNLASFPRPVHNRIPNFKARKTLLVPTPRLKTGLFNRIITPKGATKEELRVCSTSQVKSFALDGYLGGHSSCLANLLNCCLPESKEPTTISLRCYCAKTLLIHVTLQLQ
uniref:Uncharacterized protein n=1 Tax=Sinocyclocheilus rhinocerous TaxID=307959 RepID=A0A673MPZ6_9TELE